VGWGGSADGAFPVFAAGGVGLVGVVVVVAAEGVGVTPEPGDGVEFGCVGGAGHRGLLPVARLSLGAFPRTVLPAVEHLEDGAGCPGERMETVASDAYVCYKSRDMVCA
jgi:hypothetical protein